MSLVPDELRQCRAVNARELVRCRLQVTEATTHIADHMGPVGDDGRVLNWADMVSVTCTCPAGYDHPDGDPCIRLFPQSPAGSGVRDNQVGGDHYRKFKIQPWDIWDEYDLDRYLANCVKYLLRAGRKGPKLEDLKKARHYLDKAIEREGG